MNMINTKVQLWLSGYLPPSKPAFRCCRHLYECLVAPRRNLVRIALTHRKGLL